MASNRLDDKTHYTGIACTLFFTQDCFTRIRDAITTHKYHVVGKMLKYVLDERSK